MRQLPLALVLLSTIAHADSASKSAQAQALWAATCHGRDLCVTELPPDASGKRCNPAPRRRVDKRSDTRAAIAALKEVAATHADSAEGRHDGALAQLRLADNALESYLALDFPLGLDFSAASKDASTKRFDTWVKERTRLGAEASHQYEAVLALKDPETSITAAARLGQLSEDFWAALHTAEIPKDVRSGDFAKDKVAAFCDQLAAVADPLAKRAREAFDVCVTKSTELKLDTASTQLCRREAGVLAAR